MAVDHCNRLPVHVVAAAGSGGMTTGVTIDVPITEPAGWAVHLHESQTLTCTLHRRRCGRRRRPRPAVPQLPSAGLLQPGQGRWRSTISPQPVQRFWKAGAAGSEQNSRHASSSTNCCCGEMPRRPLAVAQAIQKLNIVKKQAARFQKSQMAKVAFDRTNTGDLLARSFACAE